MKRVFLISIIAVGAFIASNLFAVDYYVEDLGITPPDYVCKVAFPNEAQNNAKLKVVVVGPSHNFVVAWGIVQNGQKIEKGRVTYPMMAVEHKTYFIPLDGVDPGPHMFWAKMFPDGEIYGDTNLNNNYMEKMLNLQKCPRDFKASTLTIETQITPESINNLVSVKYVVEYNSGMNSLPSVAELKENGTVVGTCNVPVLHKSSKLECKSWWKYRCPITLTFTVDATNTNDEMNENNNESNTFYFPCPIKKHLNKNNLTYDAAKKK